MNETQAAEAGLVQLWASNGSKKQNLRAIEICDDLTRKGVKAIVIPIERDWKRPAIANAVWRDKEYLKRCRV